MAIAFDTVSSGSNSSASSLTYSHTSTGSDLLMFVGVFTQEGSFTVTGITYNSVALTNINNSTVTSNSNSLWYLIAPSTGTNNVVVTRSTTTGAMVSNTATYTGAAQSGVPDAQNTNSSSSASSLSVSVTTVADPTWIVGFVRNEIANNTAGANTTMRVTSSISLCDTNADQSPAGAYSLNSSWTGGSGRAVFCAASFGEAGAVAFIPQIFTS